MFTNDKLQDYLKDSSSISSESKVVFEWNLNLPGNIAKLGNYRNRPYERETATPEEQSLFANINNVYDPYDEGGHFKDATYSDVTISGGVDEQDQPLAFTKRKAKEQMLFSLEECVQRFRPRSGINKVRFFNNKFLHHTNSDLATRPRYYMASRDDNFKYWTSYREEGGQERGIAKNVLAGRNLIDDAAPFVVYEKPVPANRIVVKMQTNVGSTNLGPFSTSSGTIADPLFGEENKTTPVKWSIQYLKDNRWVDAVAFNSTSSRRNGQPVIASDGYVEIQYGLIIPDQFKDNFFLKGTITSASYLPDSGLVDGEAYHLSTPSNKVGAYYVWDSSSEEFKEFSPTFGWQLVEDADESELSNFVTELVSPPTYLDPLSATQEYAEYQNIGGIRVVVEEMNKYDSTFDLIELSPRLKADLTDFVSSFSVTKPMSDLGATGIPVGQLLASTGTLSLFDSDMAFSSVNENSIIKDFLTQNAQVKLYDVFLPDDGYKYYVPIKTLYVDGMPEISAENRTASIILRDKFFLFESLSAPELLIPNTSMSYAIATLLDYVGYSNYTIKSLPNQDETIIPYFYVDSSESLAQVLQKIAVSTQSAMFFDEFNNFVIMTKEYLLAQEEDRPTNLTLKGSTDSYRSGVYSNLSDGDKASIIEISTQDSEVINDGIIRYSSRYIQKAVTSRQQNTRLDRDRNWTYKPSILWEVAAENSPKSQNEEVENTSDYVLGAFALNSDLNDQPPYIKSNRVVNNTIDIGESVYTLSRYNGYLYSNGEIIRFDAVQYNVPGIIDPESQNGNVWISSVREYQKYFSKIPFNGKMYPTGTIRIYSEPSYKEVDGNVVLDTIRSHGRAQFNTQITSHSAGLDSYWSDNSNVRGVKMESRHIFAIDSPDDLQASISDKTLAVGPAGISNDTAIASSRNGIIKNYLGTNFPKDTDVSRLYVTETGTVQSSALVMSGGIFSSTQDPLNYISYVHKPLNDNFRHFGTRMRIVGTTKNNEEQSQSPFGSMSMYKNVGGGSAGLSFLLNPSTNNGYYIELIALDTANTRKLDESETMFNVVFYKIMQDEATGEAVPVVLWGGISNIIVDSGDFVGQYRMLGEENPSVYDVAAEYEDIGSSRRFYIYLNNKLVQVVDDDNPLPRYNHMAPFIRGSSKAMFENLYAVGANYSSNASEALSLPEREGSTAPFDSEVSISEAFRKYAMSGIVQSTALSGISPEEEPKYNLYFEEFGTIMREAAYFNVRYDKAYPALYARLTPTFNRIKSYVTSGFIAGAYGAEFLIFNATDTMIVLDDTGGNYLQIQGITFTQKSDNQLTMDDFYSSRGNFSDPMIKDGEYAISPLSVEKEYNSIKNSRTKYGRREFTISADYIQSQDDANDMMSWLTSKVTKPRLSIGLRIFPDSTIQLGDMVKIDYQDESQTDILVNSDKRFIVYHIEYSRSAAGPEMTIFLSEVPE